MKFITRAEWRARPRGAGATTPFDPLGVCVHWEGAGWTWPWAHDTCDDKVRSIQAYHMDARHWSDIAYSELACPHGYVFEGRGLNRRPAANGSFDANTDWYAVQCMWGTRSGSAPTALLAACRDAIDYCRQQGGAGPQLRGHRDLKQTDCPGDQLYAWVRNGAPRPNQPPLEDDMTDAQYHALMTAITNVDDKVDALRRDLGVQWTAEIDRDSRERAEAGVQWSGEAQRDQSQRTDLGVQFTAVHGKLDTLLERHPETPPAEPEPTS